MGGQCNLLRMISSCLRSISMRSCPPSQAVRILLYRLISTTAPLVSSSCISLNIFVFASLVGYYYKMNESQLNDKIKYWQYHLKKNKKSELKESAKKTPEKKKGTAKSMYLSNHPNSIVNTIDKLKLYLHQSETVKTEGNHKRQAKKMSMKDNDNKTNKTKSTKATSMYATMKLSKTLTQKMKLELTNSMSKSKSKSKQKSKSKIIKSKKSNEVKASRQLKQQKDIKNQKKSPTKKVTKKKKNKSPSPTKCFTIRAQSPMIRQEISSTKMWAETANLKTEKSRFQTESTHFRLWQEHEQVRYNMKRKYTKTINRYLKSFAIILKSRNQQNKPINSYRSSYSAINLQTMIKSQQSKLLQLRAELGRLKNSNNLNESLQIIISKVNENISSLKKIEYSQKESLPQKIEQEKAIPQLVKSFHNSTRSVDQSEQSFASDLPEVREPILMMDSLTISNDETSHMESKSIPIRQYDNLKEQSSICLLDSKFLNVTLTNQSTLEENGPSTKKANVSLLKSPESMLLNFQSQPSILSNDGKSQSKLLLSDMSEEYVAPAICFTVNEVKYFPVEERSQEESLESQEFLMYEEGNHKLLNRINNILHDHAGKFDIDSHPSPLKDNDDVPIQQKAQLCNLITDELIRQMIPFLGNHQFLLEKLIETYALSQSHDELQLHPIQYTNQYLLQQTDMLLTQASKHYQLYERLRNPLGVEPFVNLRYIRISLIEQYSLGGLISYNEEDYQEEIDREMMAVEQKAEVLLKEHLDYFDEQFGNQESSQQIILNRCLYEAVNNTLDHFRPFGSTGLPIFYVHQCQFQMPSLQTIKKKLKNQMQKYMNLRLRPFQQENKPTFDNETQIRNSIVAHTKLLRDQIEQDFRTQDQDSMERYELMLMIENYILSQESWALHQFFKTREARL